MISRTGDATPTRPNLKARFTPRGHRRLPLSPRGMGIAAVLGFDHFFYFHYVIQSFMGWLHTGAHAHTQHLFLFFVLGLLHTSKYVSFFMGLLFGLVLVCHGSLSFHFCFRACISHFGHHTRYLTGRSYRRFFGWARPSLRRFLIWLILPVENHSFPIQSKKACLTETTTTHFRCEVFDNR